MTSWNFGATIVTMAGVFETVLERRCVRKMSYSCGINESDRHIVFRGWPLGFLENLRVSYCKTKPKTNKKNHIAQIIIT